MQMVVNIVYDIDVRTAPPWRARMNYHSTLEADVDSSAVAASEVHDSTRGMRLGRHFDR
jgi:hypothetical protein